MIKRGIATFTLDYGKCPPWLYERMVRLGRAMTEVLILEFGPDEFIKRIADPVWFQALGTVLAFDWNASGLTTILTAALKDAIRDQEQDLGVFICGGKGKTSRKTPEQIENWGERLALPESQTANLVYNSKMSAKVDSALIQDGFQLYHHAFFFSRNGAWTVVQQGMNQNVRSARRYHWYSENITDLVCEPHSAISSQKIINQVLDLTARDSTKTRDVSVELTGASNDSLIKDLKLLDSHFSSNSQMVRFDSPGSETTLLNVSRREFKHHPVEHENFGESKYLQKILSKVTDLKPKSYEQLVAIEGVGPKTLRALALVGEMIYGAKASRRDPARYSFAHGGKDGTPYLPDYPTYDKTIEILEKALRQSKIDATEKEKALKRLSSLMQ